MNGRTLLAGLDKAVSKLGLGTAFYRLDNKDLWFDVLDRFFERGGTVVDTGRGYRDSEDVIGLWCQARSLRKRAIIITKGGLTEDGILPVDDFETVIAEELTDSLRCLRTDYVDLYMLHRDNPLLPVARVMDSLNAELARGRIRTFGVSNWEYRRVDEAQEYARKHDMVGLAAVSNSLSLAVAADSFYPGLVSAEKAGERWHAETHVPLIAWSSQARGFFTGRYTSQMRDNADRIEDSFTRRMLEVYGTDENFERLRRAEELGRKTGRSAVQVALAWVLHKTFPVVPVVGPQTREELASCLDAASLALSEWKIKWLNLEV